MRNATLIVLWLIGCNTSELPSEIPVVEISRAMDPPNWTTDSNIAAVYSRVSPPNRYLVLTSIREIAERESEVFQQRMERIEEMISFQERTLEEVLTVPINPEDEEGFIYYCANARVKLELLKMELFHQEELKGYQESLKKLIDSLPAAEAGD